MNLSKILNDESKPIRAIYLSSYIPRKCGIATFTKDLTSAINNLNPLAYAEIIALNDDGQNYEYPWEVKIRINQMNPQDYSMAVQYINQSGADIINLQHEFGLFGGVDGDYILPMIDSINKPIVSTFHTILPNPDEHKKYIMKRIVEKSMAVVAMTESTRQILIDVYGCDPNKATVIHHGVPDFSFNDTQKYKDKLKIKHKHMILSSGLISPGKGLEYAVEAMKDIVKAAPDTVLYIVGETHPGVKRTQGEAYREKLEKIVADNNLDNNVVFVNKYVTLEELVDFYKAADIFITPHIDRQQPTSGTLSYGLGAGNVCVSTPYNYAKEVLKNGIGVFVEFESSESIATEITKVLLNPELMKKYKKNAYNTGRQMTWPNVAQRYLNLFRVVVNANKYELTLPSLFELSQKAHKRLWDMATSWTGEGHRVRGVRS